MRVYGIHTKEFANLEAKQQFESELAKAFPILMQAAEEQYGSPEICNIKRLRNEYRNRLIDLRNNPQAKRLLNRMKQLEQTSIEAYLKLCLALCRKLYTANQAKYPGLTLSDLIQEAAIAIYDATYSFDGRGQFSTYITFCARNRLISYLRKEEPLTGIGKGIKKLRIVLQQTIMRESCTLEEGIQILAETNPELKLDQETLSCLRSSMKSVLHYQTKDRSQSNIYVQGEMDIDSFGKLDEFDAESEALHLAIARSKLTELESMLVEAYMRNDKTIRKQLRTQINPNTGTFFSPQVLSQAFMRACSKIRNAYELADLPKAA